MRRKVDINFLGFIYILISMFVGSISDSMTFVCVILSAIIAFTISSSASKVQNVNLAKGIVTLLMFQNMCIGLGAHLSGNTSDNLKFITQIPFMTLSIVFLYLFLTKKLNNEYKQNKYFMLYLFLIIISLIIGHGSILSILINLRNLITFFFAYSIGKTSIKTKDDFSSFVKYLFLIATIMLFFGIILLIFGYDLYKIIGLKEVYIAKGAPFEGERLDSRFTTTLYKNQVIRMGSLLYEPVNLAYFFALTSIISLFYKYYKNLMTKIVIVVINLTGLFLTYGKGGYLVAIALVLLVYLTRTIKHILRSKNIKLAINIAKYLGFLCLIFFCIFYYKKIGAASSPHFWAIERTWKSVLRKPIGYGLGTGGNMAFHFNNYEDTRDWLSSGGETAFMSFMYQLGIQGVLFLTICMLSLRIDLKRIKNVDSFKIVLYFIPYVILGISILQDNTFTPQCVVPIMLVLGGATSALTNENKFQEE